MVLFLIFFIHFVHLQQGHSMLLGVKHWTLLPWLQKLQDHPLPGLVPCSLRRPLSYHSHHSLNRLGVVWDDPAAFGVKGVVSSVWHEEAWNGLVEDEITEYKRLKIKPYVSSEASLPIVKLYFLLVTHLTFWMRFKKRFMQ